MGVLGETVGEGGLKEDGWERILLTIHVTDTISSILTDSMNPTFSPWHVQQWKGTQSGGRRLQQIQPTGEDGGRSQRTSVTSWQMNKESVVISGYKGSSIRWVTRGRSSKV